jgi:nucleoside-diphosphate-sugar epimerase
MRVLVTGATGFVGRHLCNALRLEGTTVCGVSRRSPDGIDNGHAATVVGELPNSDHDPFWRRTLSGVDAVVHLAAAVHDMDGGVSAAEYRRTNVDATLHLARICRDAGVARFVFLSTIKVNGDRTDGTPYRVTDTPCPIGAYALSKRDAEDGLRQIDGPRGMRVVILRPPLVYGATVKGNVLRLLRGIWRGTPIPCGRTSNRRSMIGVRNLCSLVQVCLVSPAAAGQTFLAADTEPMSTRELAMSIGDGLGRSPRLVEFPDGLLRALGALAGRRSTIDRLLDSLEVDIAATSSTLGWNPPHSAREEVLAMARWYRGLHEGAQQ